MGLGPASLDSVSEYLNGVSEEEYRNFPYLVIWLSASDEHNYSEVGDL